MTSQWSRHCVASLSKPIVIDEFVFKPLNLPQHLAMLQSWFNQDYARFWGMQGMSLDALAQALAPSEHKLALIGEWQAKPLFMVELYDPAQDEVGEHYVVERLDCGMHLILAPIEGKPIHGLSRKVMEAIAQLVLETLAFTRLVVEPDQQNHKIHRLNCQIGIRYQKAIQLSTKAAFLGFCSAQSRQTATQAAPQLPSKNRPVTQSLLTLSLCR
ncbi:GNAT family N-acetyltransferase [Shewanella xiamenensis]|uniref:GNAT family N-acetyltransferase n=1 Tax=Shewanella xiamenensis TaxID=332186 RepID=UPI001666EAF9|nr:GNAT family N-acetyltransferase [Shewanella xiamenensis]MCL1070692.1 acetyltransferase [Shewanella xiamenensis]GGM91763.1 N-hydroxyputrescine-succinyl CoA transferase PubB [Shewanella xiamenensis]